MQKRSFLRSAAALALTGGSAWLAACTERKPEFKSVDITGADYAKDFRLMDHNGRERSLADFRGKVLMLFFWATW